MMAKRNRSCELVFSLQWRNTEDKCNIVGIYDTPATTSSFEVFKSYLLKNSGVDATDVKVTCLTDSGHEWVVVSQEWFEIALNFFRLKARLSEVIHLKLEKIYIGKKHSNDVETQSEMDSLESVLVTPPDWFLNYMKEFRKEIVEEVLTGIEAINVASSTEQTNKEKKGKPEPTKRSRRHGDPIPAIDKDLMRTFKFDRKLDHKLEKLDAKTKKIKDRKMALMGQLENDPRFTCFPTTKSGGEVPSEKKVKVSGENFSPAGLCAVLVRPDSDSQYIHLVGGEVYLHTWEVINNGQFPWPTTTELRLTWGSADLVPLNRVIACPMLKPGESGTISVRLEVPKTPGAYESYWNFYTLNVRFGQALRCYIYVDHPIVPVMPDPYWSVQKSSLLKTVEATSANRTTGLTFTPLNMAPIYPEVERISKSKPLEGIIDKEKEEKKEEDENPKVGKTLPVPEKIYLQHIPFKSDRVEEKPGIEFFMPEDFEKQFPSTSKRVEKKMEEGEMNYLELKRQMEDLKIDGFEIDSDWESVWSNAPDKVPENEEDKVEETKTNSYGISENDLIVDLSVGKEEEEEEEEKDDVSDKNNNGNFNNNGEEVGSACGGFDVVTFEENDDDSGFVHVLIDGTRHSLPKTILHPQIIAKLTDQDKPPTKLEQPEIKPEQPELPPPTSSPLPAASSPLPTASSPRLFIFPQHNPGYEVVATPPQERVTMTTTNCPQCVYTWANTEPAFQHVPNYQQTPREERANVAPPEGAASAPAATPPPPVHILPENLVSGAVNVASSAINTARSVINMIVPPRGEPGRWVNGHWVTEKPNSLRARNLIVLSEMGFWDGDLNATLLARYNDDLDKVLNELVQ